MNRARGMRTERRQADDRRIGKQIAQERLDRFGTVRPAQIEQNIASFTAHLHNNILR